jgi:starch phosphorylase
MAMAYKRRHANNGALGIQILNWQRALVDAWGRMSFEELYIETRDGQHHFKVQVDLGGIDPDAVCVELFADVPNGDPFRQAMKHMNKLPNSQRSTIYTTEVPATRPASDFTPRIIPKFPGVAVPLEINLILWQH